MDIALFVQKDMIVKELEMLEKVHKEFEKEASVERIESNTYRIILYEAGNEHYLPLSKALKEFGRVSWQYPKER